MTYLSTELSELQQADNSILDFIQDSVVAGLWYWDLTTAYPWGNADFWRGLGYDPAQPLGEAAAWATVLGVEDRTALDRAVVACVADGSDTFRQLMCCQHHDGTVRWLHCWGRVRRDAAGQPARLLGVLVDMTQQRNEEIRAQELATEYGVVLSNQSVFIIKTDAEGRYTYVNDFFYKRFGLGQDLIGTDSMLSIIEEDRPKCLEKVLLCFQELGVPHQVVLRKPFSDQSIKSNHWEFKGIANSEGQLSEILCLGYDVTLLVDNLEKTEHLLQLTNQQNTRLQNFAYIISHNIRSHSANLTALVKLMQAAEDAADAAMFLDMLKTSTDKLAETIVNLNEIVTANSHAFQPKETRELAQEVAKTLAALNILVHDSHLVVMVDIPTDVTVQVVPAYLDSILLNLFSNAIKYRRLAGVPLLAVGCYRDAAGVVLTIRDNGLGIDLGRNRAKVFGMHKTFHGNADARGLGLFITKNQIEAMNGRIELESTVGVGSTFKVFFNESV
ncbi:MAG: PAS domain-containing sensor histidine kinase [Hymenobacter sp.]|nr:MAG: PAS domain-containing sensor histidine kinase [Hymenobacter sp.]